MATAGTFNGSCVAAFKSFQGAYSWGALVKPLGLILETLLWFNNKFIV
jgi:hypothetical protein